MAQTVKNLPARRETWIPFLGWKDPLEMEMQSTPVFLPGEFPWTEEPGGLQSVGSKESDTTETPLARTHDETQVEVRSQ